MSWKLPALLGAALLGGTLLYVSFQSDPEPTTDGLTQQEASLGPEVEPSAAGQDPQDLVAVDTPNQAERSRVDAPAPEATREPKAEDPLSAPDQAIWVEGRVELPEGTPLDEELTVEARGKVFPGSKTKRRRHRVPVARDGRFRVALAPGTTSGQLRVRGDYLFQPGPYAWKPDQEEEVVLRPALGGFLTYQIEQPAGQSGPIEGLQVKLMGGYQMARGGGAVELLPNHRFELPGMWTSRYAVQLTVEAEGYAKVERWIGEAEPGVRDERTIQLAREARLTGLVRDEQGNPIQEGRVRVEEQTDHQVVFVGPRGDGLPLENGRYLATQLHAGDYEVSFVGSGYLSDPQTVTLTAGQTLEQHLTVRSGFVLEGMVRWNTGEPAAGATVKLIVSQEEEVQDQNVPDRNVEVDAEGRFRMSGFLDRTPVALVASGLRPGVEAPEGLSRLKLRRWNRENRLETRLDGAVPGGPEVVLQLGDEGHAIAGQVVNQAGIPLDRFRVTAAPRVGETDEVSMAGAQRGRFKDKQGNFRLEGLPSGSWGVRASANDHLEGEWTWVEVPTSQDLALVLTQAGSITGTVVNSESEPIKARVLFTRGQMDKDGDFDEEWDTQQGVSASASRGFRASGLEEGLWRVFARTDWGTSEPQYIQLERGEQKEEVTLLLATPGRVQGQVHSDWWQAGLHVALELEQNKTGQWVPPIVQPVDAQGSYRFESVPAGTYVATLELREPEPDSAGQEMALGLYRQPSESQPLAIREILAVASGQTTTQNFGPMPAGAVRLSGQVMEGTEPAKAWGLTFTPVPWKKDAVQAGARTDAQGRYSVVLPKAGQYSVRIASLQGNRRAPQEIISVEGAGDQEQNFVLPSGRLELHLSFPANRDHRVRTSYHQFQLALQEDGKTTQQFHANRMKGDVAYFDNLPDGEYRLSTRSYGGESKQYVVAGPTEIIFSAGTAPQVEKIRMKLGCRLMGMVTGIPEDAGSLYVIAFTSENERHYVGIANVGDDGSFLFTGLPEGDVWLSTLFSNEVSDRTRVSVTSGQPTQTEIPYRTRQ